MQSAFKCLFCKVDCDLHCSRRNELGVFSLIKSDINNWDVYRNEYMEDRILSGDL